MVIIYIKLGSASSFNDERLNLHLVDPTKTKAALDYTNLTDNIHKGLIAGEIIQISEADFHAIEDEEPDPIYVSPGQLETISNVMPPCPADGFVMFGYTGGQWYKILWSTIKDCLLNVGGVRLAFRVQAGNNNVDPLLNLPEPGENDFINSRLIGKTHDQLMVTINGTEIYHESLYDPADLPLSDYYRINNVADNGLFERPNIAFNDKDLVAITQV